MVSNASDDFPDPDSPVNTIRALRGRSRLTFLRLCSRAPRMTRRSVAVRVVSSWSGGSATDSRFPIVGTGVTPGVPRPFVADNARTPRAHRLAPQSTEALLLDAANEPDRLLGELLVDVRLVGVVTTHRPPDHSYA